MGIIIAIIVGGIIGWLASMVMNRDASMGIFWNVIVGVIGSFLGGWIGTFFGVGSTLTALSPIGLLMSFVGAVVLLMLSLIAQFLIGAAQQVIEAYFPQLVDRVSDLQLTRIIPALGLFGSLYLIFYTLTPSQYRASRYPKWPGVLLTTVWWILVAMLMPIVLRSFFTYNLTYGSLAGIMIALFFFWLVGLGVVIGAELNAALAETPEEEQGATDETEGEQQHDTTTEGNAE